MLENLRTPGLLPPPLISQLASISLNKELSYKGQTISYGKLPSKPSENKDSYNESLLSSLTSCREQVVFSGTLCLLIPNLNI
jgi:hypothetical protein